MNIALVLLLVAGAPPDAAKTQKAKDHVASIQASVKTLEAEVKAAGGPSSAGCAGERLTELRTLLSTAEKAAAAIQSAADADTADAQYGRIATARSKAQRLRDEADGCLKVAAASGKKNGAKVAAKSPNAKANGGGGKGAPADAKGAAGAASGAQLAANDPSRTGDGSANGKGAAGETGGKAGATKAGATTAAGKQGAAAKVAATDEGSGNGDSLKSEYGSGRDSADAGSALQQMTLTGGRTETVAGPGARAQTDAGGGVNVRTGATALASAPIAQAAPPPPPPPPPAPAPARSNVSGSDLVRKAGDHLSRIKTAMQRTLSKVEESRNAKDVVKLNCVYEKLAQIKQLLSSAEGAEVALQEALARDTGDGDAEYSRIAMARGKAEGLNQDAEGCVGQLALVVDSTTEVEVVQPEAVASTTAGTKLETAFGVISIGEDSSSTSTSSTSSTSSSTTDNSAYGSSLGYGGTTGTSSGGAPPPPPPPPVVRPQPASAF